MAYDEKNLQGIYNTLKKEGYNPPDYETFVKDMRDDNNLRGVHETLIKEGYTPPEFSEFKNDMFSTKQQGKSGIFNTITDFGRRAMENALSPSGSSHISAFPSTQKESGEADASLSPDGSGAETATTDASPSNSAAASTQKERGGAPASKDEAPAPTPISAPDSAAISTSNSVPAAKASATISATASTQGKSGEAEDVNPANRVAEMNQLKEATEFYERLAQEARARKEKLAQERKDYAAFMQEQERRNAEGRKKADQEREQGIAWEDPAYRAELDAVEAQEENEVSPQAKLYGASKGGQLGFGDYQMSREDALAASEPAYEGKSVMAYNRDKQGVSKDGSGYYDRTPFPAKARVMKDPEDIYMLPGGTKVDRSGTSADPMGLPEISVRGISKEALARRYDEYLRLNPEIAEGLSPAGSGAETAKLTGSSSNSAAASTQKKSGETSDSSSTNTSAEKEREIMKALRAQMMDEERRVDEAFEKWKTENRHKSGRMSEEELAMKREEIRADHEFERRMGNMDKERDYIFRRYNERKGEIEEALKKDFAKENLKPEGNQWLYALDAALKGDRELEALSVQSYNLGKAAERYEEWQADGRQGSVANYVGGTLGAVGDAVMNPFGLTDLQANTIPMMQIKEKAQKGEELTADEALAMESYFFNKETEGRTPMSLARTSGEFTGALAEMAAEFGLNPASGLARRTLSRIVAEVGKDGAMSLIRKSSKLARMVGYKGVDVGGMRVAGNIAKVTAAALGEGAVMAVTTQGVKNVNQAFERTMTEPIYDSEGNLTGSRGESRAEAAVKTGVSSALTNAAFVFPATFGAKVMRGFDNMAKTLHVPFGNPVDAFVKMKSGEAMGIMTADAVGRSEIDPTWRDFADPKKNGELIMGLLAAEMTSGALKGGFGMANGARLRHGREMAKAEMMAKAVRGAEHYKGSEDDPGRLADWEAVVKSIYEGDENTIVDALTRIARDPSLSAEQKGAALDYARSAYRYIGAERAYENWRTRGAREATARDAEEDWNVVDKEKPASEEDFSPAGSRAETATRGTEDSNSATASTREKRGKAEESAFASNEKEMPSKEAASEERVSRETAEMMEDEAYSDGYGVASSDAPEDLLRGDELVKRMDDAYSRIEDAFGDEADFYRATIEEDPWSVIEDPSLDDSQRDAVLEFVNAKSALTGFNDGVADASERRREDISRDVERYTHRRNGMIQPAVMEADGRTVYVVSGNVVMNEDGKGVDRTNSDSQVFVYDPQKGGFESTAPEFIREFGESVNPADEVEARFADAEQARQVAIEEAKAQAKDTASTSDGGLSPGGSGAGTATPGDSTSNSASASTHKERGNDGSEISTEEFANAIREAKDQELASEGTENEKNVVNLPETNRGTNIYNNGEGSEQNNGLRSGSEGTSAGIGVAADSTRGMAGDRDRSDIRVYEEGLDASYNEHSEYSQRNRQAKESERLVNIAKANGQFKNKDQVRALGENYPKQTGESEVYINWEEGRVYKVKDPYAKSPMKRDVAPEDAIYEHLIHNRYFPETPYKFEGIGEDLGDARIILSQPYIESVGIPSQEQIEVALAEKGLAPEGKYSYGNDEISVTDVTGDNALLGADGKVYFIDPIINFKKPAREILDRKDSSDPGLSPGGSGAGTATTKETSTELAINSASASTQEKREEDGRSAFERIPVDEKTREPRFEEADPELTWDALVETSSEKFADNRISNAEKELKKIERLPNNELEFFKFKKRQEEIDRARADAQRRLDYWRKVKAVGENRAAEAARIAEEREADARRLAEEREAEARRIAEEQAEAEKRAEMQWREQKAKMPKLIQATAEKVKDCPEAVEILSDVNPHDIWEAASWVLSVNKLLVKDNGVLKGFREMTGYKTGEVRKFFGLFASAENGGKTLERLAEDAMQEICETNGIPYENSEALNALLDVLQMCGTVGEIRNYIENNRISQAMEYYERWRRNQEWTPEEEAEYEDYLFQQEHGVTRQEYEVWSEYFEESLEDRDKNFDENEFYGNIADDLASRRQNEIGYGNRQGEITEGDPGGSSGGDGVLQNAGSEGAGSISGDRGEVLHSSPDVYPEGEGADGGRSGIRETDGDEGVVRSTVLPTHPSGRGGIEPTEAQKAAGNYKMEHRRIDGYNISIENPKGSVRSGKNADGTPWETEMHNDYGYIRGTEGVDGDHIDVFLSDTPEEGDVFVVDQYNPDGSFDEHKVMYGFPTKEAARDAYLSNYEDGWETTRRIDVTGVTKDEFKKWVNSSRRKTKPFAEYKSVKAIEGNGMIGRSLTEPEATEMIDRMESTAEVAPVVELTPENWIAQFGEEGTVDTPIGSVKMGENQYFKMARQGREGKLGMVKPTLQSPDVILEDYRPATDGVSERDSSYIFVKTFNKEDGSRYYHFTSVTVRKDGREVVISNQERSNKRISKLLQQGKVAWIDNKFSLHPTTQIEESVPLNDSNRPNITDSQPALLGINSSELNVPSGDKDNTLLSDKQADERKGFESEHGQTISDAFEKYLYYKSDGISFEEAAANLDACYEILNPLRERVPQMDEQELSAVERDLDVFLNREISNDNGNEWLANYYVDWISDTIGLSKRRKEFDEQHALESAVSLAEEVTASVPRNSKVKIEKFVHPRSDITIGGVYHDAERQMAIASDSCVLVMSKSDYKAENAGKVVTSEGVSDKKYPDVARVIPSEDHIQSRDAVDFGMLEAKAEAALAKGKAEAFTDKEPQVVVESKNGNFAIVDAAVLRNFARGARHVGASEVGIYRNGGTSWLVARGENGLSLMIGKGFDAGKTLHKISLGDNGGGYDEATGIVEMAHEVSASYGAARESEDSWLRGESGARQMNLFDFDFSDEAALSPDGSGAGTATTGDGTLNSAAASTQKEREVKAPKRVKSNLFDFDFSEENNLSPDGSGAETAITDISKTNVNDEKHWDNQGNPIDNIGKLSIEDVRSVNDITDNDFLNPTRNIGLPPIPQNVDKAIGANGRKVIIKKNIFDKNRDNHEELTPSDSRDILNRALYNPNLTGTTQPIRRPDYKVAIQTGDKNAVVVLDVYAGKDNVEIVGWRKVDEKGLEKMKRQAEREGGQFLILSPMEGSAAALSALPSDISSDGKGNTLLSEKQVIEGKGSGHGVEWREAPRRNITIEDFGEKIAGARKDLLRDLSRNLGNVNVESLVKLTLSKAVKRPDFGKMVERGAMTEDEALTAEAMWQEVYSTRKPAATSRRKRAIVEWAVETERKIRRLEEFINADSERRREIMEQNSTASFPDEEKEAVDFRRIQEMNPTRHYDLPLYTPSAAWVNRQVMDAMGFHPGDGMKIEFSIVPNMTYQYYAIVDASGRMAPGFPSTRDLNNAVEMVTLATRMQNGDLEVEYPSRFFSAKGNELIEEETGEYEVAWLKGYNIKSEIYPDMESAEKKLESLKAKGEVAKIYPVKRGNGYKSYSVRFRNPLSGEEVILEGTYPDRATAQQMIEDDPQGLSLKVNGILAERLKDKKGSKSHFYITSVYENGSSHYAVCRNDVGGKLSPLQNPVVKRFENRKEAEEWFKENGAALESRYADMMKRKRSFVYFEQTDRPRRGEDYREGRDVTPQQFSETFGFRGVQFGNWTNDADRQAALNEAYDALRDLASVLGLNSRDLSLNGELGLAFGSRGSGSANAHYESGEVVINLTKTRGAGSLAHEWWHALDNYLMRKAGVANGFATEHLGGKSNMRSEVAGAITDLVKAVGKSNYAKRSASQGKYWGSVIEETARLFGEWVVMKQEAAGSRNYFLSRGIEPGVVDAYRRMTYYDYEETCKLADVVPMSFEEWKGRSESLGSFPYPTEEELKELSGPMDRVFEALRNEGSTGMSVAEIAMEPAAGYSKDIFSGKQKMQARQLSLFDDDFTEKPALENECRMVDEAVDEYCEAFSELFKYEENEVPEEILDRIYDLRDNLHNNLVDYFRGEGNTEKDAADRAREMLINLQAQVSVAEMKRHGKEFDLSDTETDSAQAPARALNSATASTQEKREAKGEISSSGEKNEKKRKADFGVEVRKENAGGDLMTYQHEGWLPELGEGEFSLLERKFSESGEFNFSGGKIESADDVAYMMRSLEFKSIENTFGVLVKDGKATIVHVGMGTADRSLVNFQAIKAADLVLGGAEKIWLVHNHPSGTLRSSIPDENLHNVMKRMFGERLQQSIIMDTLRGEYAEFGSGVHSTNKRPGVPRGKEVDARVYRFDDTAYSEDFDFSSLKTIKSSADVAQLLGAYRLGKGDKAGVLVLDQANHVVGNLPVPHNFRTEEGVETIVNYAVRGGGVKVIVYGNKPMMHSELKAFGDKILEKSGNGIQLLDLMTSGASGYESAQDNGLMEPEAEYGNNRIRSSAITDNSASASTQKKSGEIRHRLVEDKDAYNSTPEAMEARVGELAEKLGTRIRVVRNASELDELSEDGKSRYNDRQKRAKGWWSRQGNEIVVVLPNNVNVEDVENTVVHEVVGHKGLRALVGEERFDKFLEEIYNHASDSIRKVVDKKTDEMVNAEAESLRQQKTEAHANAGEDANSHYYADMADARIEAEAKREEFRREATEEYMADLGGRIGDKGFEEMSVEELTFWGRIKAKVQEFLDQFLRGLKIAKRIVLTDKDLSYILFKSWKNLRESKDEGGVLAEAEDVVMRDKTGWDSEMQSEKSKIQEANDRFNRELKRWESGNIKPEEVVSVGYPMGIMRHFMPKIPIFLRQKVLSKSRKKHELSAREMQNLPGALAKPIFVFKSSEKTVSVLTTLKSDKGENIFVAVELEKDLKLGGHTMVVNDILTIHGREIENVVLPIIENNSLAWVDKKKGLEWLHSAKSNSQAITVQTLDDAAKIVISFENPTIEDGEMFRFRDSGMGLEETITNMKVEAMRANADNLQARNDAMRAIGGNLSKLRQAMSRQRIYDESTVRSVTDLARVMLENGLLDDLSKYETKRILSAVNNVVGRRNVEPYVQKVVDIMVDNQLRMSANAFGKLLSIKGSKVDARGIEVQGALDPDGQAIAKVVKKTFNLSRDEIENRITDAIDRMGSLDKTVAEEAALEYSGLRFANLYAENIKGSKVEERSLRDSMEEARGEHKNGSGGWTDASLKQFVQATEDAIRQNKVERVESYQDLVELLGDELVQSIERAKAWREAEKRRVEDIHHNANSDMEGRPTDEHHRDNRIQKLTNNSWARFVLAPLGTFDQMLRMFGNKNSRGEGYLWNRFMRSWVDATEKEYTGYRDALKVLDDKVSEVFGKKMKWGDLFAMDRKLPKASVRFMDGGEMKDHELTQGNLLYIYMADKMSDGRMKLRKMGITEEDIENIKNFLDPKFIELADWMQNEFLVDKRNGYNEVHKRMFGASMAAIENYFPLKVLSNARTEEIDIADDSTDTALPATSTGSIIKRKRNSLALDVTGANAFSVILDHLQEMEKWNAFAEFNRDLNTLLSYKHFRNQVMNMSSVYGGGKTLWKNFRNVCSMAAGAYRPPIAALDKSAVNIAKGVTAAKVSFRVFTALKQFLSFPAYFSDANPILLAKNVANPVGAWNWSMKNLPLFHKRWHSRMAGDPRLMKTELDWKGWRNKVVEMASRVGMSPNAFVDALTVSIGARSMYETRLAKYKRYGYDDATADRKAKQDATILFNQTQQSSEDAFVSTLQVDRSWLSVLFTVFRNSSMSYTRQLYDALRNIKRRLGPGYSGLSEEFMTKQMIRDGIDPDKADRNAKQEYRRGIIRDFVRVGVFGYILQLAWNLGAYLPYLILGDDDETKDEFWDDVFNHTFFGSIEGLTGGDVMSAAGQMALNGDGNWGYLVKDMPLASDISSILKKWPNDQMAAMNDVINLCVQSGLGMNPQSLTDAVVAVIDYCGDDAQTSRECAMLIARILNCPPSQLDKIYFDELGADGIEASKMTPAEIAERYASYKMMREAPLTGWMRNEADRDSVSEQKQKRVKKIAKERISERIATDETKRLIAESEAFDKRNREINELRDEGDMEAFRRERIKLMEDTDMRKHLRVKRYKRDIKELTEKFLNVRTPEERDSVVEAMLKAREQMLLDLGG